MVYVQPENTAPNSKLIWEADTDGKLHSSEM